MTVPVVYWPGASGHASVFARLVAHSAHRERSILVDYPGFGNAPPDAGISSLSDLYGALVAALPERCDLVAMSMGGVLALRTAIELPHRVRRLILIATSGGLNVERLGAVDWRNAWASRRPDAPTWFVEDRSDFTAHLSKVLAPTLLIFGDADDVAPVAVGRHLEEHLPRARLAIVEGGTHDLEIEHAPLLARWIDAHLSE